jgi:hypothetical protein
MGLFLSKDPANVFWLSFFKLPFISVQVDHMVALVPRTGRHLQRYDNKGFRQVVGYVSFFLYFLLFQKLKNLIFFNK